MEVPKPPRTLIGACIVALALWIVAWPSLAGRKPLDGFTIDGAYSFGAGEGTFLVVGLAVEALLVAWFTLGVGSGWGARLERRLRETVDAPRSTILGLALFAGFGALIIGVLATRAVPIDEDEKTYLFQAKLLLLGKVSIAVPPEAKAFWQPFIVQPDGRWSGQYFWAHPALMAPFVAIGMPWIATAIDTAVTVYFWARTTLDVTGDKRAAAMAAVLLALSPHLLLTGGTLHNSNLSAACLAASVWGLVQLSRGWSTSGTAALAISTSIGLHARPFDHAALLIGVAAAFVVMRRREALSVALRVLPAVALTVPAILLHAVLNRAISGDWRHSGYWLFNDVGGFPTMGFGAGPMGSTNYVWVACTKTLVNLVRVAFFSVGTPFPAVVLGATLLAPTRPRRLLLAPVFPVAFYYFAYFCYAGVPIAPTGPVYFTALTPLVVCWIAVALLDVHDRIVAGGLSRRLVPAFVLAQLGAAGLVFWPARLAELHSQSKDASACEDLARSAGIKRGIVFVAPGRAQMLRRVKSWTNWPPLPSPTFDDPVLFPRQGLSAADDAAVVRRFGERRGTIRLAVCVLAEATTLLDYDPVGGDAPTIMPILPWDDWNGTRNLGPIPAPPPLAPAAPTK